MHISEGVLSAPVLLGGAALALPGLWLGLRKMTPEKTILCGVLAAVFFTASLIHVPIGPGNAHLLLNGLLGLILGWAVFPALLVALALQALLFQFGGLTTLGVNICAMGYSAILARWVFYRLYAILPASIRVPAAAFAAGFLAVAFSAFFVALALGLSSESFVTAGSLLFFAHIPIMLAEGVITALTIEVLARTSPALAGLQILQTQRKNS